MSIINPYPVVNNINNTINTGMSTMENLKPIVENIVNQAMKVGAGIDKYSKEMIDREEQRKLGEMLAYGRQPDNDWSVTDVMEAINERDRIEEKKYIYVCGEGHPKGSELTTSTIEELFKRGYKISKADPKEVKKELKENPDVNCCIFGVNAKSIPNLKIEYVGLQNKVSGINALN